MSEIKLTAQKRTLVGKKVKKLRKEGLIPANIFGKKIKSQSLSLNKKEFEKVFAEAGETGIVNLTVEGGKESHPVMIQNLQKGPVTDEILHADLRQVILTEKVTADIPVEMTGEAPAAEQKLGILIQNISEIEVEALPLDLPEKFVVDVSGLNNVGDEILVKSIKVDKAKVELKIDESQVVIKIEPLAKEEVAPPPVEPEEGEAPEGEAALPAEGEEKSPEPPSEEKKE
ncbi:50S ribosomal protein L25 [Candidatus Shapirobacteria bacterium CG_4_9_14_0_2_um_filter_40_11]|uniref:Large ribosomal subunit protein bL25 n=1 Tax=Candidatus Shapirobacteria bacterium CG_4_9_14_0_2_um_filter_40_11 TaxID=1974876 RepID=A0A2M8EU02_9BACT|nr:MAG: 50S ribosomal protein L25 [Candidatus Shapirobacteria bacterium CG_4_9_14_0_2_um_filter_40_11]